MNTRCGNTADSFEDAIGHVTGMRQFRKYLDQGPGSKLLKLWLDIEKFFGVPVTDPMTRWMIFREIQVTFYDFENRATDCHHVSGQSPCVLIGIHALFQFSVFLYYFRLQSCIVPSLETLPLSVTCLLCYLLVCFLKERFAPL